MDGEDVDVVQEGPTPVFDEANSKVVTVGTPFERSIARGAEVGAILLDEAYEPSNTRLRNLGVTTDLHETIGSDELVSMGSTFLAENGGSLRTFSGGLSHECGWWPGYKARCVQHWEGIAALNFMIEGETNRNVVRQVSEGIAFRFYLAPKWYLYTADSLMNVNGRRHVVEIKRTERDLRDPEYRMKLAAVAEICRRCGWIFRIVLADEIFVNRLHEENCRLFSDRRFVHIGRRTLDILEGTAITVGAETSYGELAERLAPGAAPLGEALIQGLVIRGRVDIDLTTRVYHRTPIRII